MTGWKPIPLISRLIQAAHPQKPTKRCTDPERVAESATLSGSACSRRNCFRWCRCAQPPANSSNPYRDKTCASRYSSQPQTLSIPGLGATDRKIVRFPVLIRTQRFQTICSEARYEFRRRIPLGKNAAGLPSPHPNGCQPLACGRAQRHHRYTNQCSESKFFMKNA